MIHLFDVIVIGAGQAGIAISHQLQQKGIDNHLMVDSQKRIGDAWRFRYKSLVLFTPKSYSALPGLVMKGDPNDYPTKDEMADYLEAYVEHFNLPHKLNIVVTKVDKDEELFNIYTENETFQSRNVVVASGAFKKPFIPSVIRGDNVVTQIHSSLYTEPSDLDNGSVLIVGGNSGAQIAVELARDREVILAVSQSLKYLPLQVFSESIFYWLDRMGLLYAGTDTIRGRTFQKRNDPIFGKELKQAIKSKKVILKPRVIEVNGNQVVFSDDSTLKVDQIIWTTGFVPSYVMIDVAGVLDEKGSPIHKRGVSPVAGLYYIGLPWQHSRGSALVCGVGRDAKYIAENSEQKF